MNPYTSVVEAWGSKVQDHIQLCKEIFYKARVGWGNKKIRQRGYEWDWEWFRKFKRERARYHKA